MRCLVFEIQRFTTIVSLTSGDDSYYNFESNKIIYALAGNDSISTGYSGPYVTVNGDGGSDTIENRATSYSVLNGGEGDDSIANGGSYVTVNGDGGSDTIGNGISGYNVLNGGEGNDYIFNNFGSNVTINGGIGNDSIYPAGVAGVVAGGLGDDYINLVGKAVLTPVNSTCLIKYNLGDGNDTITDISSTDTLQIGNTEYTTAISGNDIIVKVGQGNITIKDSKNIDVYIVTIVGGDAQDTTEGGGTDSPSGGGDSTLPATRGLSYSGDSSILFISSDYKGKISSSDYRSTVKIIDASDRTTAIDVTGNSNNNSIEGCKYNDTLNGGAGDDTINARYGNDIVNGDSGDDVLDGGFGNDTLTGGSGNDVFVYSNSRGDDVITDYTAGQDVIKITNGSIKNSSISGNDVVLNFEYGSLRIKDAAKDNREINLINSNGNSVKFKKKYVRTAEDLVIDMAESLSGALSDTNQLLYDAINKKSVETTDTLSELVKQIKVTGMNKSDVPPTVYQAFASVINETLQETVIDKFEKDPTALTEQIYSKIQSGLKSTSTTVTLGKGNNAVDYNVNINLFANMGVAVSFASVSWNGKKVWLNWTNVGTKSGNEALANYCSALAQLNNDVWKDFISYALTGTDKAVKFLDMGEEIIGALCDKKKADALIKKIGGKVAEKFTGLVDNKLQKFFEKYVPNGKKVVNVVKSFNNLRQKYTSLVSAVNSYGNNLKELNENSKPYTACKEAYEQFQSLLNGTPISPVVGIKKAATDFFSGIGEFAGNILGALKANSTEIAESLSEGKTIYVDNMGDTSTSKQNALASLKVKNNALVYSALNSSAQNINVGSSTDNLNLVINTFSGKDMITTASSKNTTVNSGAGNDTIKATGKGTVSINAGKGNDVLIGGSGADTLTGGAGNDTLTGGSGKDIFVYAKSTGNDVITDYTTGTDKIKLTSGSIIGSSLKGSDVILKVGSNYLTVKDSAGKKITVTDSKGKTTTKVYSASNVSLTASANNYSNNNSNVKIYALAGNDYVYNEGSKVSVFGGLGKDTIYNYGEKSLINSGEGNDRIVSYGKNSTLIGGKGNDTITGYSRDNQHYGTYYQYAYGDGNDLIYGFDYLDTLQITSGTYTTVKNENNVIVNVGEGKITLSGSAGQKLKIKGTYGNTSGRNISNSTRDTLITGTAYDDTIYNENANYATINSGTGNDSIYNNWGWYLKINGGDGDDTITDYRGSGSLINGGAGNDNIYIDSYEEMTLVGGKGNDTIEAHSPGGNYGVLVKYASGDGDDIMYGLNSLDTIQITSGTYTTTKSGSDLVIKVGEGSIRINNGIYNDITVIDSNNQTKTYGKSSSSNVAELWFDDEGNLAQIDSITQNGLSDYAPSKIDTTSEWSKLTPADSLTSYLSYSQS